MSAAASTTQIHDQAERAAATGDFARAQQLFGQVARSVGDDPALWMKFAAMSRRVGQPKVALGAVQKALEQTPRDFTALLMRASLMTALEAPGAPEAWTHALAQRPDGELPPPIADAVARGERIAEQWNREREQRLAAAMAVAEAAANPDELVRMARFRSNTVRRTRPYHSEPTHFHYPGLVEREFHPRSSFTWLAHLEAATDTIASELKAVMEAERNELVPYIQYADHVPMDQWKPLNRNPDWTAIHLCKNGERVEANAAHCPQTMALLDQFDQPRIGGASPNAMFSLLAPNTAIPPHVGVSNARLVCHLPLIVPEGCWFRVGAETRYWKRGEAFVFDDTIEHEAMNPTAELRVVFIFDLWHPGLSPSERAAVKALLECEGSDRAGGL